MSEKIRFEDLKRLADLGYKIRLIKESLEKTNCPFWLINAIIEATTGYVRKED